MRLKKLDKMFSNQNLIENKAKDKDSKTPFARQTAFVSRSHSFVWHTTE